MNMQGMMILTIVSYIMKIDIITMKIAQMRVKIHFSLKTISRGTTTISMWNSTTARPAKIDRSLFVYMSTNAINNTI